MRISEQDLAGVLLFHRDLYRDSRGVFTELFNPKIEASLGSTNFAQDNISYSKVNVIRGMHWQVPPYSQGKLITCINGKILDVVLNVDESSRDFGKFISLVLDSKYGQTLWIPPGYAHGFEALTDEVIVHYKTDLPRLAKSERRINPLSPRLKEVWVTKKPIVSKLDLGGTIL